MWLTQCHINVFSRGVTLFQLTSEDRSIQEHEERSGPANFTLVLGCSVDGGSCETPGGKHADTLSDGSPIQCPFPADPVQSEHTYQGGEPGAQESKSEAAE